jgi:mRNA interferase RelE/StbE
MMQTKRRRQVQTTRQVEMVLRKLSHDLAKRLDQAILGLAQDPQLRGCIKLRGTGYDNLFRIRVGECRISYVIEKDVLIVLIVEVAQCRDAYRF